MQYNFYLYAHADLDRRTIKLDATSREEAWEAAAKLKDDRDPRDCIVQVPEHFHAFVFRGVVTGQRVMSHSGMRCVGSVVVKFDEDNYTPIEPVAEDAFGGYTDVQYFENE